MKEQITQQNTNHEIHLNQVVEDKLIQNDLLKNESMKNQFDLMESHMINKVDDNPNLQKYIQNEFNNFNSEITSVTLPNSIKSGENPFQKELTLLILQLISESKRNIIEETEGKFSKIEAKLQESTKTVENDQIKIENLAIIFNEAFKQIENIKLESRELNHDVDLKVEDHKIRFEVSKNKLKLFNLNILQIFDGQFEQIFIGLESTYHKIIN